MDRVASLFLIALPVLLVGCAGNGSGTAAVSGFCAGGRCTGVCVDEVNEYARQALGSEATDVYFSFANADPSPLSEPAVVYFRTEACPDQDYQAQFYGSSQFCNNTHRGRLPQNVGKLLVIPEGCPGPR